MADRAQTSLLVLHGHCSVHDVSDSLSPAGPAALPKGQSTAARASLTSLHMGKNIVQKKEIIKGVK